MPSINQCDTASGNVAALPSTLEIFDKFKPVTENGKDSDSEESFHLPLDDDDIENQSITSNGKDIHNEENEEDILNKFDTAPSATPDHLDPKIEDSILNDDDVAEKNEEIFDFKKNSDRHKQKCGKVEVDAKNITDESVNENLAKDNDLNIELKLSYADNGEYEESNDGVFKSIYETDEVTAEECQVPADFESMEIIDDTDNVDADDEHNEGSKGSEDNKLHENLSPFEDVMEVEDGTNEEIENIIEKLDQDTPMEDTESSKPAEMKEKEEIDQGDVNMEESTKNQNSNKDSVCDQEITNLENVEAITNNIENKEDQDDDVEMVENNEEENLQENIENQNNTKKDSNENDNHTDIFQKNEQDIDATQTCFVQTSEKDSETQEVDANNENLPENKIESTFEQSCNANHTDVEPILEGEKQTHIDDLQECEIGEPVENPCDENKVNKKNDEITAVEEVSDKAQLSSEKVKNDELEKKEITAENTIDSVKVTENHVATDCNKDSQDSDLLNELDNILNNKDCSESENNKEVIQEVSQTDKELTGNKETVGLEGDDKTENQDSKDDDEVFKVPEEVTKPSDDLLKQDIETEEPDTQSEASNDKTDDDEASLLDVSMVREAEEDDACAYADALNNADTQASERSDEEQSEKVDTEQESSDRDNENDHDDNDDHDDLNYDAMDDDTRMDDDETEEMPAAETSTSDKENVDVSSNSKDSYSNSNAKALDADIEVAKNIVEEPKEKENNKMDVSTDETGDTQTDGGKDQIGDSVNNISVKEVAASKKITIVSDVSFTSSQVKVDEMSKTIDEKNTEQDSNQSIDSNTSKDKVESLESVLEASVPEANNICASSDTRRQSQKRSLSPKDVNDAETAAKKPKLTEKTETVDNLRECIDRVASGKDHVAQKLDKPAVKENLVNEKASKTEKIKTLSSFSKFMQCRKLTAKLSRSDLEQFCIQKICESLMLKSSEGDLHQTIKKQEKLIENLRKDLQQLTKQSKDLEIVNKKLMNELRSQTANKKPLVPLKITRSVGLQVRLNPGNETPNQTRRRQPLTATPTKQATANVTANKPKTVNSPIQTQSSPAVRQVMQSPQKSPLTTAQTTTSTAQTAMLSQALQQPAKRAVAVVAKRTATPVRKAPEPQKPNNQPSGNSGVIDLTDEDDKLLGTKTTGTVKIINKQVSSSPANKTITLNKVVAGKTVVTQNKPTMVVPSKTVVGQKGAALGQGIRLAQASVIGTSASGSPQMVYVVPTITSNSGGTQKVAFVNFQPTNGIIPGSINGSTVSVVPNKQGGQTLTLKTVPTPLRNKHPAPLPPPPRINPDPKLKPLLPKPHLTIKKIDTGIILQWKMPYKLDSYEDIASYQLYAYQETSAPPSTDMWRKVGDVKALALPMACTLTQFADKNKYYFAVRSVDVYKRIGAFSDPEEISL